MFTVCSLCVLLTAQEQLDSLTEGAQLLQNLTEREKLELHALKKLPKAHGNYVRAPHALFCVSLSVHAHEHIQVLIVKLDKISTIHVRCAFEPTVVYERVCVCCTQVQIQEGSMLTVAHEETDKLDRMTSDTQKRHLLQHLAHIRASLIAPSGFLGESAMGRIHKSALYSDFCTAV